MASRGVSHCIVLKIEIHLWSTCLTSPRFLCLFSTCCSHGTSESSTYGKQRICLSNSWSAHFHVSWLSDFIFYQKPLYKSLHQSFFYSFITILPSESGVTHHYSTILLEANQKVGLKSIPSITGSLKYTQI